jgi:DNA-binding transcriptional LysR family regulator
MKTDNLDEDQLPHLGTFSRAAEFSNFTAAAKSLDLTQAAVSQRIQALEKILDLSLFRRQGGRVFLTEVGQRLYDHLDRNGPIRTHWACPSNRDCLTNE